MKAKMRSARTIACIVVRTPKVFTRLGDLPVMKWCVRSLNAIRGLGNTICVAAPELVETTTKLLRSEEIETLPVPRAIAKQTNGMGLDRWLCGPDGPAADAEVVMTFCPLIPFLPAAKIEACLDSVVRDLTDTCSTVREVDSLVPRRQGSLPEHVHGYTEVFGCRVWSPNRVHERQMQARFKPVTVTLIESLNISTPDDFRVANAVVLQDG